MKYTVQYKILCTVEMELEPLGLKHLHDSALWTARNDARRSDVELVQVLPEGVKSCLGRDNPAPPEPPTLPKPPAPPGTPHSGDLRLAKDDDDVEMLDNAVAKAA